MTILEAIHRLESAKPNSYEETEKISWLSVLDGVVKNNIKTKTVACGLFFDPNKIK